MNVLELECCFKSEMLERWVDAYDFRLYVRCEAENGYVARYMLHSLIFVFPIMTDAPLPNFKNEVHT